MTRVTPPEMDAMDWEQLSARVQRAGDIDFTDQPVIAAIQAVTGLLKEVFGSMCWAA
jgi:hypothetical protein